MLYNVCSMIHANSSLIKGQILTLWMAIRCKDYSYRTHSSTKDLIVRLLTERGRVYISREEMLQS